MSEQMRGHCGFDIETQPKLLAELEELIPPFDEDTVAYGNRTKEESRKAWLEECRDKHRRKYIDKAALNAVTGELLVYGFFDHDGLKYESQENYGGEAGLLATLWENIHFRMFRANQYVVGHCILQFDLPFLWRRSLIQGVTVPRELWEVRNGWMNWNRRFVDTYTYWKLDRREDQPSSFNDIALAMSTPLKPSDVPPADFHKIWVSDQNKALEYLRNDVRTPYEWVSRWEVLPDVI
jgi:hypothetical protein